MKEKSIHEDYAMWVLNDGEERNPCQPLMIITFIVPAYNSEGTLEKCLHSLLDKQSQSKIEILIVNDGSTDSTAEIAQVFVNKHPNCRLINKENGGHGSVINVASKLASGKYIKVIDSDDWV
ncbi:MAG: glycosyltransferase family 2 protein, partial [Defluviitaleaceae bacterium]|nr:glycosyltransferase family 2 protein [Defluviitaleaceae bacterium]